MFEFDFFFIRATDQGRAEHESSSTSLICLTALYVYICASIVVTIVLNFQLFFFGVCVKFKLV